MASTPIKFHSQAQTVANYLAPANPNAEFKFYRLETWCPGEQDTSPQKVRDIAEGFSSHVWQGLDPTTRKVREEIAHEIKNQINEGKKVTLLLFSDAEKRSVTAVYFGADYGKISEVIPWLNAKEPDVPNIRVSHDRLVSEKLAGKSHWFEGYFSEASSRNKIIRAIATVGE